ncbi:hypothetical protein SLEP1_g45710 [Rubroshorea leprosula]|uniref:Reverse transcriptase domain-containing protein n=1 Tax=Rubroshorea leprosula TaxID=152421 RepID=A0AAV5LJV5_9ROSI|nr:hypothetical protein SLEP1_g45710 [Rubroshorea leprosula]
METKKNKKYLERLRRKYAFSSSVYIEPQGYSGGLALWWTEDVHISIFSSDKNMLDGSCSNVAYSISWHFSFVYGEPNAHLRQAMWSRMMNHRWPSSVPWLIMGDLNLIGDSSDKKGKRPPSRVDIRLYEDLICSCSLREIAYKGATYTWVRGNICERLDRALSNDIWGCLFPNAQLFHCTRIGSDHCPLISRLIHPSVIAEMNHALCRSVSDDEICSAVFQLGAFRAPRVDGFPGCFYQQHWDLVGPDSAFIHGRAIQDNILIAHEAFHGLQLKKSGKHCVLALKLDIRKAYDSVDWHSLEHILRAHGFCEQWIHMVMQCVSTVSYTVGINGNQTPIFVPQRRLRQGDSLSPYLYLFIADLLSRLLMAATIEKKIFGYTIRRRSPTISHLFFADDFLVFCRAIVEEVSHLQTILQLYGDIIGQRVNYSKSAAVFSPNTPKEVWESNCEHLGIRLESVVSKYLGLPTS